MVGIISDRTKSIDRTLRSLASDFRRTNIKSVKVGEAQPNFAAEEVKKKNEKEGAPGSGVLWGDPKTMQAGKIKIRPAAPVHDESPGFAPQGKFKGPRAGSFIADHEKLQIDK